MPFKKILKEFGHAKKFLSFTLLKVMGDGFFYILPLLVARFIAPAEFGTFSLVQLVCMVVATVFITSSQTPFIIHAAKEHDEREKINKSFTNQLIFLAAALIVGFLGVVFLKNPLISFTGISADSYYFIYLFYAGLSLKTFFENILLALNYKSSNAAYSLVVGVINIALVIVFKVNGSLGISSVLLGYFISSVCTLILFFPIIPFRKITPLHFDAALFKDIAIWTHWQIFGLIAVQLINWGDNIILRNFVSLSEIGKYNIAYQIFKGMIGVSLVINSYFLPLLSRHWDNKAILREYVHKKRPRIYLFFLAGLTISFFLVPALVQDLYGPKIGDITRLMQVLILALPLTFYSTFYTPLLNALGHYRFLQLANIGQVILNIGLDIVLIPRLGIMGAAIATVTSYFVRMLANEWYFLVKIKPKFLL